MLQSLYFIINCKKVTNQFHSIRGTFHNVMVGKGGLDLEEEKTG